MLSQLNRLLFTYSKAEAKGKIMTPEMNSQKPEWFEIAEGDARSADVRKVNKKLPAIAVLVTGAVIATGAIFANASEEQSANAQVSQSQVSTTPSPEATLDPSQSNSQSTTPGAIQNPKIDGSQQQRGDYDDDDYGDDDGDHEEHGDRPERGDDDGDHDHHERREHHDRGPAGTTTVNPTLPSTGAGA